MDVRSRGNHGLPSTDGTEVNCAGDADRRRGSLDSAVERLRRLGFTGFPDPLDFLLDRKLVKARKRQPK